MDVVLQCIDLSNVLGEGWSLWEGDIEPVHLSFIIGRFIIT